MAKYTYPAIYTPEDKGAFSDYFPDLEGCYTCGDTLADALFMAEDVLAFTIYDYERSGRPIPVPSTAKNLSTEAGEFINLIACDTMKYRKLHSNKAVKKTLTIPEWLNESATLANLNFSQVLQEALIAKLQI